MARCPYLGYDDRGPFWSQGDYYCKLCGKCLDEDREVKHKCKTDSDDYTKCPVYKDR